MLLRSLAFLVMLAVAACFTSPFPGTGLPLRLFSSPLSQQSMSPFGMPRIPQESCLAREVRTSRERSIVMTNSEKFHLSRRSILSSGLIPWAQSVQAISDERRPAPSPSLAGEEVVSLLMRTLKDGGLAKDDAALTYVLGFASERNLVKELPAEMYVRELRNPESRYSLLTSDYRSFRVSPPEVISKTPEEEVRWYFVSVEAPLPLLKTTGVAQDCISPASSKDQGVVTFLWQLSKSASKSWMYDSVQVVSGGRVCR